MGGAATVGPRGAAGAWGNWRSWWGDLGLAKKTRSTPATRASALYVPRRSAAGLSPFAVPDTQWSCALQCHSRGTVSLSQRLPATQPQQRAHWLPQWPGRPALLLAGRWCPGVRPSSRTNPPHTQAEGKCCCCACSTGLCQVRRFFFFCCLWALTIPLLNVIDLCLIWERNGIVLTMKLLFSLFNFSKPYLWHILK